MNLMYCFNIFNVTWFNMFFSTINKEMRKMFPFPTKKIMVFYFCTHLNYWKPDKMNNDKTLLLQFRDCRAKQCNGGLVLRVCDALHVARSVVSLWWFCFSVAQRSSKLNERCDRDNVLSFCTGRGLFIRLKVSGRTAAFSNWTTAKLLSYPHFIWHRPFI